MPLCIRVAGPNAGHSVVHPKTGVKYALRQIPVGAVTNPNALLGIAAGSEIDPYVLDEEVKWLEKDGIDVVNRLYIDPSATWLTQDHKDRETNSTLVSRIGSTGKGIGAARADRIMRTAPTVGSSRSEFEQFGYVQSVGDLVRHCQELGGHIQVEGTQGYGLGLHGEHYPQVTSSDCTAIDFLAMARINPWYSRLPLEIWVVFRPYPIRVAGNSGPMHGETTWEELGLQPEYTTVTKKLRRVGQWDRNLAQAAVFANGHSNLNPSPVRVALTMADQIDPSIAGTTDPETVLGSVLVHGFQQRIFQDTGLLPELVTTSDRTCADLRGEQ